MTEPKFKPGDKFTRQQSRDILVVATEGVKGLSDTWYLFLYPGRAVSSVCENEMTPIPRVIFSEEHFEVIQKTGAFQGWPHRTRDLVDKLRSDYSEEGTE